jgi:hypothetical protein
MKRYPVSVLWLVALLVGCDSQPAFHGPTIGKSYQIMQTWKVVEHDYAKNDYTFIGHNTKDSPSDKGLTVKITARCAPLPVQNTCPFYAGQVLKVALVQTRE